MRAVIAGPIPEMPLKSFPGPPNMLRSAAGHFDLIVECKDCRRQVDRTRRPWSARPGRRKRVDFVRLGAFDRSRPVHGAVGGVRRESKPAAIRPIIAPPAGATMNIIAIPLPPSRSPMSKTAA